MNEARRKSLAGILKDLESRSSNIVLAQESLKNAVASLEEIKSDLETARDEEQEYLDNMPESLQQGDKGTAANEAIEQMTSALEGIDDVIAQADELDLGDKLDTVSGEISDATA